MRSYGAHDQGGGLIAIGVVFVTVGRLGHGLIGIDHALIADNGARWRARVNGGFEGDNDGRIRDHRPHVHAQLRRAAIDCTR